jgi:hypothetical protein
MGKLGRARLPNNLAIFAELSAIDEPTIRLRPRHPPSRGARGELAEQKQGRRFENKTQRSGTSRAAAREHIGLTIMLAAESF